MTNETHPELFDQIARLRDKLNEIIAINFISDSNAELTCLAMTSLCEHIEIAANE